MYQALIWIRHGYKAIRKGTWPCDLGGFTPVTFGLALGANFKFMCHQGGVTPIEPVQTLPTGGFDRLDRPNLGGMVTFSHGLMHL